jgi:hypothetical protein
MATEDFTGYTPEDPNSDFTITASKIAFDTMTAAVDAYVRDNKGSGYFGDFEHLLSGEYTSVTVANYMSVGFWGLSSVSAAHTVTEMNTENDGLILYGNYNGTNVRYYIKDFTNDNSDIWASGAIGTQYWFTVERAGTTLTCKIYSDSGRTTLVDTLTLTCNSTTQQYIYGLLGQGGAGSQTTTGFTENLDLQEVVAGIKASPLTLMGVGI